MKPLQRSLLAVWAFVGLFAAAVLVASALLLRTLHDEEWQEARARVGVLAGAAEAGINRALLGIDLLLSGGADMLRPAVGADGRLDPVGASRLLEELNERNLLVHDLAVFGADGRLLAAATGGTRHVGLALPEGFVASVLGHDGAAMRIGVPRVSPVSGERMLHFGRPITLPGGQRVALVIETPLPLIVGALAPAADLPGAVLTLERADGVLLASSPPHEHLLGRPLASPLPEAHLGAAAYPAPGRLDGRDALTVARPTLYPGVRISASLVESVALASWVRNLSHVVAGASLFLVMMLAAGALTSAHLIKLDRAHAALDRSNDVLDKALASMADGFLLCDAQDRVVRWNTRLLELFPWLRSVVVVGIPYRNLLEATALVLLPGSSLEQRRAWVAARRDSRGDADRTWEQDLGNGIVVHGLERRMPDGGLVGVYRDVTAAERRLERARAAAEAANAAKSQFLATISHELRTPLNAALGLNGLLLDSPLDAEQRRWAELVRSSGQTLLAVINDILDVSKIDAGRLQLEVGPFDPARTIGDVLALMAGRAADKGLALEHRVAPGLPPVLEGDSGRLAQVLYNLVGNAVKFTEQGRVQVEVSHQPLADGRVELDVAVRDTGVGIPPEALPTIFDPFTQADGTAARRFGGSGLGLAISREIVALMGGRLDAANAAGGGSVFRFRVPLRVGTAPLAPPAAPEGAAAPSAPGAGGRILVVEDNAVNQILIKAVLDRLGHFCDLVGNGIEAVRQVQQARYDLVLMDVHMPEMDGLTATREIRRLPPPAGRVPIVAMTADAMADDREACLAAGMNDHLAKPIDVDALAQAIERARRAAAAGGDTGA